jgi:hypothetical protein
VWPEGKELEVGMRAWRPGVTINRFGRRRGKRRFAARFAVIEAAPTAISPRMAASRP